MSAIQSDGTMKSFLAEHPKMTGVLFTILMLLSQAGAVAGGNGCPTFGP